MFNSNIKFIPKKFNLPFKMDDSARFEEVYGIGIYNKELDILMPTPLSSYIRLNYSGKSGSLNSQKNAAYELTKFLNFIVEKINNDDPEYTDLANDGLSGLQLIHGAEYITNYTELTLNDKSRSTSYVYTIEKYLINFYNWLKKNSLIEFESMYNASPFNDFELGTRYPIRDERINIKLSDFGENRIKLALQFVETSLKVAPEISLGICFQLFGGLRIGEVVNLTKDSISKPYYWSNDVGANQFILEVRDRQEILFNHKKNLSHEQVKRPRNQAIMTSAILSKVYMNHKKNLKQVEHKTLVKEALFISPSSYQPMSGKNYMDKFKKIKEEFLLRLSNTEQVEDYLFLTAKPWSTHICRGVFTNILLSCGMERDEVAIARGDKNTNTIIKYVEEMNSLKQITNALEYLNTKLIYDPFAANLPLFNLDELEK
ncbi:hypothetical protein [Viridibacillus arvi]|uniref:hypothetical protein n=1 Tax=Viridibacillus arvi TaxID=263475 RepID=UPI003CFFAAF6